MSEWSNKDSATIIISCCAFLVSATTFIINLFQKRRDNLRAFRKELTDVIKEIVETNVSIAKIEIEAKSLTNKIYDLRRSYNTRRRYLIDRAEFLIKDIPQFVNQVDYVVIAHACVASAQYEKAKVYFANSIEIAAGIEQIFNMRGYARFLYMNSEVEEGRRQYNIIYDMLTKNSINVSASVQTRELADTILFRAKSEYMVGDYKLAKDIFLKAKKYVDSIKIPFMKSDLQILIHEHEYLNKEVIKPLD